ncbi:MAG TPA: PAS domain S-box protein, partial [Caldilineaceae bacterium]|nr:PAS domain S-box protein [Caldilineaceae bacterium]
MIHNLDNSGRRRPANGLAAHSFSRRLPVLAFAVDQAGKLAATSDQFGELLGYTAGELAGSSVADLLSTAAGQRFESAYLPLLLATGQLKEVECEFIQHDGTVTPLLLSASAEQDEAGALLGWQAVLAHPDQRTQAQRVLLEILEGTAALTGGDFFRSLVRHVARSFRVCYAMITECTDQTLTRVRTLACYKYENFLEQFEYNLAGGPCEAVIAGGVCHYPRLRDFFPKEDQDAYLGVPILGAQGNVLGHLVIEDDKEFQPGPYDIEILQLFAARAGAELERKRAEEALRKREHQLQQLNDRLADSNRTLEERVAGRTREIEQRRQVAESLRDMVLILNSQRPLDEILTYIVAAATGLLGTESGAIYTLQPDQQMLAIQTTRGMPA